LERQRRANNPKNYNENGTIKKGKKKWEKSNRYKETCSEIAEIDRKTAAHRKSIHGHDQNILISQGTVIKAEKIPYKAFQKIWGKSVSIRAPSMFMSGLKRKAENAGGCLYRTRFKGARKLPARGVEMNCPFALVDRYMNNNIV